LLSYFVQCPDLCFGSLAKLLPSQGQDSIRHYNGRRSSTITADVDTDIITSLQANQLIRDKFAESAQAQPGLRIIFGGKEKSTQESRTHPDHLWNWRLRTSHRPYCPRPGVRTHRWHPRNLAVPPRPLHIAGPIGNWIGFS